MGRYWLGWCLRAEALPLLLLLLPPTRVGDPGAG